MSTPASLRGAATRARPRRSPPRRGRRTRSEERVGAARHRNELDARVERSRRVRRTARLATVASVARSPTRRLRVDRPQRRASGWRTPTTGIWSAAEDRAVPPRLRSCTRRPCSLTPARSRKAPIFEGEVANLGEGTWTVRQAGAVTEVDEVLVRERDEALVEHGQPTHSGVEYADRSRVHPRDCREAADVRPTVAETAVAEIENRGVADSDAPRPMDIPQFATGTCVVRRFRLRAVVRVGECASPTRASMCVLAMPARWPFPDGRSRPTRRLRSARQPRVAATVTRS